MLHRETSRYPVFGAAMALSLIIAAGPQLARAQQPSTPAPGGGLTIAAQFEKSSVGMVEGSVAKVDSAAQTVYISTGLFGLLGRTLGVNDQTQIQVEGRQGTLADLREGTRVKAAYEGGDGKAVATLIEVMTPPASERRPSSMPSQSPGSNPYAVPGTPPATQGAPK